LHLPVIALLACAGTAISPFLHAPASAAPSSVPAMLPPTEFQNAAWAGRATVARLLARVGVLSIRSAGMSPSENDYTLTAGILGLATELNPGDLDLLRRSIDAWQGAGRRDRVASLTSRLVELDPEDRVAQLRLISSRINDIQTASARIAAYDRILSPAGNAIDASIRSRLALDAALLAREMGDEDGFLARLTRATQLDATNKDAAALAASIVLDSDADELARVETLLNVVIADPMDASSHANLSRELRGAGAFEAAQRFQDNADAIYAAEGRYDDPQITYERLLTLWGSYGPETVAASLDDRERALRTNRTNEIAAYQAAGRQPPPGPAPEQVTLEPILEVLRASANIALGRANRVETTARLLTQEAANAQQVIAQAAQQGAEPAQVEQASEQLKLIFSELLWLRLWSGVQTADAEALLTSMRTSGLISDPSAVRRYEGFIALRKGEFAKAQELLGGLADSDPRARIGLALLEESRGNTRAAAANLAPLAIEQTGSMLGLYARSTIERLLNSPVAPSPVATRINEYFRSVPRWLDEMTRDPREFMVLEAAWPETSLHPLDGLPLILRLRNIGRIPLPVGPNLTINSRLLLSPDPTIGGEKPPTRLQPEVAELNRTLRIMPGQGTEIRVNTGLGAVGAALDNAATQVSTIRWQVAQGFLVDQQGTFYRGPTSVSASSPLISRRRLSIPDESVDGIRRALDGAQGDRVLEVLMIYRDIAIRSLAMEDREFATQITTTILQSTATRMPRMSELERAAAVLLVASVYPRDLFTPIDEAALNDRSVLVRTCAVVTRVNNPDHPTIAALIEEGSDTLDELMRAFQERLRIAQAAARRQQQGQSAPAQGQQGDQDLRFDPTAK
jgi:hypothetical protein